MTIEFPLISRLMERERVTVDHLSDEIFGIPETFQREKYEFLLILNYLRRPRHKIWDGLWTSGKSRGS